MCNKQYHAHELEAQAQALSLVKGGKANIKRLRIYECEKCGGYHITRWSLKRYKKSRKKTE